MRLRNTSRDVLDRRNERNWRPERYSGPPFMPLDSPTKMREWVRDCLNLAVHVVSGTLERRVSTSIVLMTELGARSLERYLEGDGTWYLMENTPRHIVYEHRDRRAYVRIARDSPSRIPAVGWTVIFGVRK